MFKEFTLEDVYKFAEKKGFSRNNVSITREVAEVDDDYKPIEWVYCVEFGYEYDKTWTWTFEDLNAPAVEYEFTDWEEEYGEDI